MIIVENNTQLASNLEFIVIHFFSLYIGTTNACDLTWASDGEGGATTSYILPTVKLFIKVLTRLLKSNSLK